MKSFLEFIALLSIGRVFDLMSGLIKGYFLRGYLHVIDLMRGIYFTVVLTIASMLMLLSGFLLLHIALFLYLPWSIEHKILALFILGLGYMIIPLILVGYLHSNSRWLKISGAKAILDDLSGKKNG